MRCGIFGMWLVEDVGCLRSEIWDVWDAGCLGCGMFGMWDEEGRNVQDVRCSRCGIFGMWNVRDVECFGCRIFGMWNVHDVGCFGCGMLWMWNVGCWMFVGMWDVDLQNALISELILNLFKYVCWYEQEKGNSSVF